MKRPYLALWSILAVAYLLLLLLATCADFSIAGWHPKKSGLADIFMSKQEPVAAVDTIPEPETGHTKFEQVHLDDSPKTLLIIGDSMLEGLAPRLSAYCDASGDQLYAVIWYSSTTELYGQSHLLSDYIRTVKPDYIFLSLGGNELFVADIAEKRDKYVKSILSEIGDIPFVWIGPPNWKPDTGINSLIKSNVPEGCFFLSDGMHFDRKKDGAHPTAQSAALWMDSIVSWMPEHARFLIDFKEPQVESKRPTRLFLHMPGELTQRPE